MSARHPVTAIDIDASRWRRPFFRTEATAAVQRFLTTAAQLEAAGSGTGDGLEDVAGDLWRIADKLVSGCRADNTLLTMALASPPADIASHALNVATIAVTIASRFNLGTAELQRLAFAALVHEVGSVRLPACTLRKRGPLSLGEYRGIRIVPFYSHEIIGRMGRSYARIAEIVCQVNERADGTGFPRRLRADRILIEARVIGAADFVDACRHCQHGGSMRWAIQELAGCPSHFGVDVVVAAAEALSAASHNAPAMVS